MRGGLSSYFKTGTLDSKTIYRGGNYTERFEVTEDRYRSLLQCLRLRGPKPPGLDVDPWWEVRDIINNFNINMQHAFSPGNFMVDREKPFIFSISTIIYMNNITGPFQTKLDLML